MAILETHGFRLAHLTVSEDRETGWDSQGEIREAVRGLENGDEISRTVDKYRAEVLFARAAELQGRLGRDSSVSYDVVQAAYQAAARLGHVRAADWLKGDVGPSIKSSGIYRNTSTFLHEAYRPPQKRRE